MSSFRLDEYEAMLEALREKNRLASLRVDISEAFNRRGKLDVVLQACTEAVVKNLDAAFARIWVLDKPGEVLELKASAGLYTHLDGPHGRVKVGDFKIGRIAKNLKPHVSNSVTTDPEVSNPEWARREGMVSFAGYPLTMDGKALGVVAFFAKKELSETVLGELEPIAKGIAVWIKREQAEIALSEQLEWFNVTLKSIGDAVVATDIEGKVTYLNAVAENLTGWSREEALGQPLERVFPILDEGTRKAADNPVQTALREGRVVGVGYPRVLVTKKGNEIPIDHSASPIRGGQGEIIGVILVFHDVTARRRVERQKETLAETLELQVRERTAQLEETVRSLEGVSYSIAHDLGGPLRSMEGFSSALLEDCSAQLSPTGQSYAKRIAASARRMDTLLKELLTYGKLAHQELRIEPVSADEIVTHAIASLSGVVEQCHAEIQTSPLGMVSANAAFLERAMMNLLTNALKFVKPGVPPRIFISSEPREKYLRLMVRDEGIGMLPQHLDRVFRIFERLDALNYPGTGIGLAIVQKSIQRMGGRVGVESSIGQGSTFWIELPSSP